MLKLKELLVQKGMTAAELSRKSGVSIRTIEDMQRRGDGRLSTARKLCDALGAALDELYPPAD